MTNDIKFRDAQEEIEFLWTNCYDAERLIHLQVVVPKELLDSPKRLHDCIVNGNNSFEKEDYYLYIKEFENWRDGPNGFVAFNQNGSKLNNCFFTHRNDTFQFLKEWVTHDFYMRYQKMPKDIFHIEYAPSEEQKALMDCVVKSFMHEISEEAKPYLIDTRYFVDLIKKHPFDTEKDSILSRYQYDPEYHLQIKISRARYIKKFGFKWKIFDKYVREAFDENQTFYSLANAKKFILEEIQKDYDKTVEEKYKPKELPQASEKPSGFFKWLARSLFKKGAQQ